MSRIIFIIPYFGKWPVWFPAFLISCRNNLTIQWMFFTDCPVPDEQPDNVLFHRSTVVEMQELASNKIGSPVKINYPTKFCDLKPAYGHIFEEYILDYDFWGFCDIDIIWGDIRAFISSEMLQTYDIISSRKQTISGHFTILRNNIYNRFLYRSEGIYKALFEHPKYRWFDENSFASIVTEKKTRGELKVWWDKYLVNHENGRDSHQEYYIDRWLYENKKLYDLGHNGTQKVEHMYLHFINWKVKMKSCTVEYLNFTNRFFVSYKIIKTNPHSDFIKKINTIKNRIYGFWIRENIRIKKIKVKKVIHRIQKKLLITISQ